LGGRTRSEDQTVAEPAEWIEQVAAKVDAADRFEEVEKRTSCAFPEPAV